jgi:hypothetical protein
VTERLDIYRVTGCCTLALLVRSAALRIRIQGDSDYRIAVIDASRQAIRARNVSFDVVGSTDRYDYNIALVEGGNSEAAAVPLDAAGVPVA